MKIPKSPTTINSRGQVIWLGIYLTEEEIVNDILAKILLDPKATKLWLDPISWTPPLKNGFLDFKAPAHAGCLMHAGMQIRNWYGLWHDECPFTVTKEEELQVEQGIITDPRHPDNLSARVIEKVRKQLEAKLPGAC